MSRMYIAPIMKDLNKVHAHTSDVVAAESLAFNKIPRTKQSRENEHRLHRLQERRPRDPQRPGRGVNYTTGKGHRKGTSGALYRKLHCVVKGQVCCVCLCGARAGDCRQTRGHSLPSEGELAATRAAQIQAAAPFDSKRGPGCLSAAQPPPRQKERATCGSNRLPPRNTQCRVLLILLC